MSQKRVPFLNLGALFSRHREEFLSVMTDVIDGCRYITGPELEAFEKEFATWLGPDLFSLGCGNGTDAITLATLALDLPEGSEAVIPAMTFVATAEGLLHAGLKVQLADVTEGTWLVDPKLMAKAITPKTRLLAPVHLYGQMAPMDAICALAEEEKCRVLEDAAQAHGARWKDRGPGTWGDVATFSFFPGKNLGAFGDGGGLASRSQELVLKASALGKHGGLKKYEHTTLGFNSRLDNVQAAVLRVKLKYIDLWNQRRREIAGWYRELLSDVKDIALPVEASGARHVYHLFVVLVEDRKALGSFLKDQGVDTGVHYPLAIHQLPVFRKESFAAESFPNAEKVARHGISLPMCPTLEQSDVEHVAHSIRRFFGKMK